MARQLYSTVSIPRGLHIYIQQLIKQNPQLGYVSVADFVKESIREKLQEVKKQ
jgi:Arc/MetJ-type ribon-helix-helix transcriptional regulator